MSDAPEPAGPLAGIRLDRRSALSMAAVMLASGPMLGLAACSASPNTRDHHPLLLALLDLVIPATDAPGAANRANADFILRAIDARLLDVPLGTLDLLSEELEKRAGGPFERASPKRREIILAKLDQEVLAGPSPRPSPWLAVKSLILMSYFTSEAGASRALRYELVPGRYDPDVVVDETWRPLSNDWSANSIRKAIA